MATRKVLSGVPKVGFFPDVKDTGGKSWPEDIIFPSCMRAVMEFFGYPEYDYIHFVGVTGAGWFLNWKDGWHGDNAAIYFMVPYEDHLKLFEYAFDSTGYGMELVPVKGQEGAPPAEVRQRLIADIDAGRPVLSHGVVGPPETCILTGYDDGGEVAIGWSFFQHMPDCQPDATEPNGMFRQADWEASAFDLFQFGERGEPTAPEIVRRRSLEWAVKVVRTPSTWGGRHNGLAAYDAWCAHLLKDDEIDATQSVPEGSTDPPFVVHSDAVGTVAEARHYASEYLLRMVQEGRQMRPWLLKAAGCYSREHDLMWEVWGLAGGLDRTPENAARFADPATRRQMIALIQEAKREDEMAIEFIERVLS